MSCVQDEGQGKVKDVEKKIKRNENAIVAIEKKHHIRERWSDLSRVFVTVKSRLYEKRKSELLLSLHCMASERCFLVELKRKYADGQAIAIKLAKQIDKVVKSIHKTLSEINGCLPNDVPQILYDDAKDPKSSIYSEVQEEGDTVPALVRRQIIDLFCLHNRCQEELELLKEEMNRLVSFLQNEIRLIDESVDAYLPYTDNPLNAGVIACLKKKRMIHCNHISSLLLLWGGILDSPKPIGHAEVAKTYANLSGIDYPLDDEKSDESMMEEVVDDEAFVLELTSDSELSDNE